MALKHCCCSYPDTAKRRLPPAPSGESRKLTAAEQNYPAHFLKLLAVVHVLLAFLHYLLGGGEPLLAGCW
jgi:hypothetical protein